MKCIFHSYVHSAVHYSQMEVPECCRKRKEKPRGREWADGEILHAGNKSSTVSTPSVVEPLPIYSDGRIVCPYELRLTVAELSGWRSPPRRPPSTQTQTGPGQRGEERGEREGWSGGAKHNKSDGSFVLKSGKRTRSRQWRYLGANQAWSLVADVLESGSNVNLLHTWKRVDETNDWASCRFRGSDVNPKGF